MGLDSNSDARGFYNHRRIPMSPACTLHLNLL
jgi:hypothetical protein